MAQAKTKTFIVKATEFRRVNNAGTFDLPDAIPNHVIRQVDNIIEFTVPKKYAAFCCITFDNHNIEHKFA
jgi:hypothetical protein